MYLVSIPVILCFFGQYIFGRLVYPVIIIDEETELIIIAMTKLPLMSNNNNKNRLRRSPCMMNK